MPILRPHIKTDFQTLGLWNITEDLNELLERAEKGGYNVHDQRSFRSELKQKQWLAIRLLLQSIDPNISQIQYKKTGAPWLNEGFYISMSHSHERAALLLNPNEDVGLDIQQFTSKISRIKHKFVSDPELEQIGQDNEVEKLILLWSAKEAIFKRMKIEGLLFKKEIAVSPFELSDKGAMKAQVKRGSLRKELFLKYEILQEYSLVYTVNP